MFRFLNHPEVLERLYYFVFERSEDMKISTQFLATKPFDDKYNKSSLIMMRKKFEERIRSTKIKKDNFMM